MEEHKQRFGCEKPIIGCLHLRALPGTPLWDPSYTMEQHVADLKEEAHILMELGFDGAVFANEADYPYVGAVFCRGFFLGSQVGNYGEIRKTPGDIWRYAKSIGAADVAVYSSFEPHNGSSLDTRSTEEMFNTYYKDTPVAGYSMNGPKKGEKPSESMIAKCKALNPDIPINFNNGANPDNIKEMLKYCDMVVVGTTLKKDHYLFNPIDYDNAKAFITAARS